MKTVIIKSNREIELMRQVGSLAAKTLKEMGKLVVAGNTPAMIDKAMREFCAANNAIPATVNYMGFPDALCVSVNDVICHGIPGNNHTPFKDGDIVNLDVTPILNGYHGDTNATFVVGEASDQVKDLVQTAKDAMWAGIEQVKPGATLGDIGHAIETLVKAKGYSIVEEYGGHGIGLYFHEGPSVSHTGKPGQGLILKPGMTFTIEPMINMGKPDITHDQDGWTVRTADGSLSAQFEHTILVTSTGYEVLTLDTESTGICGEEENQNKDQEGRPAGQTSP